MYDRSCLTPVNHPLRMFLMVLCIIVFTIIIANILYDIGTFLCILPWHIIRCYRHNRILFRIKGVNSFRKLFTPYLPFFTCMCIINLIAYTPHQNTRMISISFNPICKISLIPILKKPSIVIRVFLRYPHIKRFRHNQYPHSVCKFHHLRRRHIMSKPQCIYPHLL